MTAKPEGYLQILPSKSSLQSPAIFGQADILHHVQMSGLFKDSKCFVDLKLKRDPELIRADFLKLAEHFGYRNRDLLQQFIVENFDLSTDAEFEEWDPVDWKTDIGFLLDNIRDESLRNLVAELHILWKTLSKKNAADIRQNPSISTSIPLPHGFIIPGGRFKETYYWDTYWIVRGLLKSKMEETAKGIIDNFLYLIKEYGFVPNGTRTYYLGRSQPPFLLSMMEKYTDKTQDFGFLERSLPLLEQEIRFFEEKRSLTVTLGDQSFFVFRYGSDCRGPRPEAYVEDMELASHFDTDSEREEFFLHIKSAAESGWDFSSRWIISSDGSNQGTLENAKTNLILPVDLNALMFKNYRLLSDYFERFGNEEKSVHYKNKSIDLLNAISTIFWDADEEMWFDFDLIHHSRRRYFYASNLVPLWCRAYPLEQTGQVAKACVSYLEREKVLDHPGGLPTSKYETGQQWDFNCWPPLQHLIVSGLNKTEDWKAKEVAFQIAKKYVQAALVSCGNESDVCRIYEKYHPILVGSAGGGGEYQVQVGFGWSNAVLLDLINYYGDYLITHDHLPDDLSIARCFT